MLFLLVLHFFFNICGLKISIQKEKHMPFYWLLINLTRRKIVNWEKSKRAIIENSTNVQKQPLEVFHKKTVLRNFAIFIGKHLCWSLFLIKLFQYGCFMVNIGKFLKTAILKNICEWLLLDVVFNSNEQQHLLANLDEMG